MGRTLAAVGLALVVLGASAASAAVGRSRAFRLSDEGDRLLTHSWIPSYAQFRVSRGVQSEMRRTNREIADRTPALLGPRIGAECSGGLTCRATAFHGARYLLAVNPSRTRVHATLRFLGARGLLRVFGTVGRRAARAGTFTDTLPALSARIYISPPKR